MGMRIARNLIPQPAIISPAIMQNTEANRNDAGPPLGPGYPSISVPSEFGSPCSPCPLPTSAWPWPPQSLNGQPWPGWSPFIWITVAMFGARPLGMSANRLIHAKEDSANPRTADRHLPSGLLKSWEVSAMAIVGSAHSLPRRLPAESPGSAAVAPCRRLRCLLLLRQVLHLALQLLLGLGSGYRPPPPLGLA